MTDYTETARGAAIAGAVGGAVAGVVAGIIIGIFIMCCMKTVMRKSDNYVYTDRNHWARDHFIPYQQYVLK